jgi:hypothetical protein
MAAASIHLSDRVLPEVPVRQFVLSVPYELRLLLACNSEALSAVIRIMMRVVLGWYRVRGRELGLGKAEAGAVSFVQRSGGSLNLNTHLHSIAIDGVYTRESSSAAPVFHFVQPPSAADLALMVRTICERVCKMLGRRGLLGEPRADGNEAETTPDALVACRKVALSRGRFERLDVHGRSQQQLFPDDEWGMSRKKDGRWTADFKGFSLHAGVSFSASDRKGTERLVRYCTRPPLAIERLSVLGDGSVAYKLKYASKRRSHRVMSPLEFMARLACIIAPPRLPLTRYHGVLAPNSSWRRAIVAQARACTDACEPSCGEHVHATLPVKAAATPVKAAATLSPPPPDKLSKSAVPRQVAPKADEPNAESPSAEPRKARSRTSTSPKADEPNAESPSAEPRKARSRTSTSYVPWAELMRRTFGINVLCCPVCSATMVLLAVITQQHVIAKILTHVNVPREPVANDDAPALYYDVTGEPVPSWALGVDPEPDERGPPTDYDVVDPPAPDL